MSWMLLLSGWRNRPTSVGRSYKSLNIGRKNGKTGNMSKEFKLSPGEITQIGKVSLGNFTTQNKWYIIQENAGNLLIANVNRPDRSIPTTFEEPEEFHSDPI